MHALQGCSSTSTTDIQSIEGNNSVDMNLSTNINLPLVFDTPAQHLTDEQEQEIQSILRKHANLIDMCTEPLEAPNLVGTCLPRHSNLV